MDGKINTGDEYTCFICKEVFKATCDDSEAIAKMETVFQREFVRVESEVVCDECWRKMMGLPPEKPINPRELS